MSSPQTPQESNLQTSNDDLESSTSDSGFLTSLNHSSEDSDHIYKLVEFHAKMDEVNLASTNYATSEFVLNIYRGLTDKDGQISERMAKFVKDTISTQELQKSAKIESRNGESFDMLGLDDCFNENKHGLSPKEHFQLKLKVLKELQGKVETLKIKKKDVREIFAKRSRQEMVDQQSIPCQKKLEKVIDLHNNLTEKFNHLVSLLVENGEQLDELQNYQQSNECKEEEMLSLSIVPSKVKYLNLTTSILKEKIEFLLNKNENYITSMNSHGNELEQRVNSLKERANSMKHTLDKYMCKEKHSEEFRELVKEYGKTQRELKHKRHTLSLLVDQNEDTPSNKP